MNFLKNKVKRYFGQRDQIRPPIVNAEFMCEQRMEGPISSDTFEVLVCEQQQSSSVVYIVPSQEMHPTEYYIITNQFFKTILVEKKMEERVLDASEWLAIIEKRNFSGICRKNLIFSIFKGISPHIRQDLWEILANTKEMAEKFTLEYHKLLANNSNSLNAIEKDVHRTSSDDKFKRMLKNVLVAYSNLDPLQYTQGMNVIVAGLLNLLGSQNFEEQSVLQEKVFWVFVGIMYNKNWRQYLQNLEKVNNLLDELKTQMQLHIPEILQHIEKNDLDLNICFTQYYMTLIIYNTPRQLGTIVLDLFLIYGQQIIHSLILKMLQISKQKILQINDMGQIVKFFKTGMLQYCNQMLVNESEKATKLSDFSLNFFIFEE